MSERKHYDPPLKVWIKPNAPHDHQPLPALLHSETEHEVIVSYYNRGTKQFELFEDERRIKAHRSFHMCVADMLDDAREELNRANEVARNAASIYNHILGVREYPFPDEAYDAFTAKPEPVEVQEEKEEETVQEEVKRPTPPRPLRNA